MHKRSLLIGAAVAMLAMSGALTSSAIAGQKDCTNILATSASASQNAQMTTVNGSDIFASIVITFCSNVFDAKQQLAIDHGAVGSQHQVIISKFEAINGFDDSVFELSWDAKSDGLAGVIVPEEMTAQQKIIAILSNTTTDSGVMHISGQTAQQQFAAHQGKTITITAQPYYGEQVKHSGLKKQLDNGACTADRTEKVYMAAALNNGQSADSVVNLTIAGLDQNLGDNGASGYLTEASTARL